MVILYLYFLFSTFYNNSYQSFLEKQNTYSALKDYEILIFKIILSISIPFFEITELIFFNIKISMKI